MDQEYRTYFPMIGDTPEVIKQKAQARKQAQVQMDQSSGPLATPKPATPAKKVQMLGKTKVLIDGVTYDVLSTNPDGTIKIRDPKTGRTGTVRP